MTTLELSDLIETLYTRIAILEAKLEAVTERLAEVTVGVAK